MGNTAPKFDIISNLPPELVLLTISYLCVTDVAHCLLVCRIWYDIISNLAPYWQDITIRHIGLSKNAVLRCSPLFPTPRGFYIAAKKHKSRLRATKFKCEQIATQYTTFFTHCLDANSDTVVRTQRLSVNQNQPSNAIILERLYSTSPYTPPEIHSVCSYPLRLNSSVAWAYANNDYLFWVTRSGMWNGYDLVENLQLFCWNGSLLKDGKGITVSCCNKCFLVFAVHWAPVHLDQNNHYSTCSMQVVKLGDRQSRTRKILPWKLFRVNHNHSVFVNYDSRYWIRETIVLSESETKQEGICQSHRMILQCDCCTVSQTLTMPECQMSEPQCINCNFDLEYGAVKRPIVRDLSSEITLSSDRNLMGMVFDRKLHVWKLGNSPELSTTASLVVQGKTCNRIVLVALGHLYSIIAYLCDSYLMDYTLHVVSVQTGETLAVYQRTERFYDWDLCCQVDPLHKFHFLCNENEEWLNDIQCNNIPDTPVVTLHNHHGRIHMEAIALNKNTQRSWRKHWRLALRRNFGRAR